MDFEAYVDGLRREGDLLADAARRVDPGARPAGCPEWTVADVVRHTGMVHRWCVLVLRERRTEHGPDDPDTGAGLSGAALADWYAAAHAAIVRELLGTDPAAELFTLLPAASARTFWARRQLHETAIHRADVESVAGSVSPLAPDAAVDGIDEALALGGRPLRPWTGPDRVLRLEPADGGTARTARVGADGARPEDATSPDDAAAADCVVRGSAFDLQLLLWNRPPAGTLQVTGDAAVLEGWAGAVRNRWHSAFPDR